MPCTGETVTISTPPSIPNPTTVPYTFTRSDSPTGIIRIPSPSLSASTMPPSPKYTASHSPPTLPPPRHMKRPNNPKRLSLALSITTPDSSPTHTSIPDSTSSSSKDTTPFTPGPPKTPSLALSMSLGRASLKHPRRPSLLSLITQPESVSTPTHTSFDHTQPQQPQAVQRSRIRASTTIDVPHTSFEQGWKTAPNTMSRGRSYGPGIPSINEVPTSTMSFTSPGLSDISTDLSLSGTSASSSSTPSSSPPPVGLGLAIGSVKGLSLGLGSRQDEDGITGEPYMDGPVEVVPLVYLGAEDSLWSEGWKRGGKRVRVLNVAQEIDNPFLKMGAGDSNMGEGLGVEEGKVGFGRYEVGGWDYEYCHLKWSHGEGGLADIPDGARLEEIITGRSARVEDKSNTAQWGFWRAIQWLEEARREGVPVLIHCQCGVSRSATLVIAYLMTLAAAGVMPEHLGHLKGMQDTYDMVKAKSSCIGPNVSLVFQLVEYSRNLTTLLTTHLSRPGVLRPQTAFPTVEDAGLSEAEWARKRREFEEDEDQGGYPLGEDVMMSPEEVEGEARRLDEAMRERRRLRE